MLVRPSARKSLSLSRAHTSRRPRLRTTRCPSLQSASPASSHRLLVTQRDLLPWRRRSGSVITNGTLHERSLATAMDETRIQDDVPFALPSMYSQSSLPAHKPAAYELRPIDPSHPLRVKDDRAPFPRYRASASGVPGDVESMLSVFHACLQVDHLDRAAMVLKRFGDMDCLPGPELMRLHNGYLRANLDRFCTQPDSKWVESMQSWYEKRIRGKALPQTPETIALMLKVSLLDSKDSKALERRVNRYMGMMPGDAGLQVYALADILSDRDLAKITSLCTTHNYTPDDFFEMEDTLQSEPMEVEESQSSQISEATGSKTDSSDNSEVIGVPQKGLGLKTLKKVLSFFGDIKGRDISQLPPAEQREIQAQLERDCVDAAINRWREEHQALNKMGMNTAVSTSALNSQMHGWHCALEKRLKEEFELFDVSENREVKSTEDMDRCLIAPFLRQSDPGRLAAISILSMLNSLAQSGADSRPTLSQAVSHVSKSVEADVKTQARVMVNKSKKKLGKQLGKQARKRIFRHYSDDVAQSPSTESEATETENDNVVEPPTFSNTNSWPVVIRTKIGATLLMALIESVKVNVVREHPETKMLVSQAQPAFANTSVFKRGKRIGMIMPNQFLFELLKREPRGDFLARHLPMLVPPEPWTKYDKGGFLEFPSTLVRLKNGEKDQQIYTEAAVERGDLEQVCQGLDVLGRTAWRVNHSVFEVMLEAWNTGEAVANLPPLNPDIPLPPEPEASEDPLRRRQWIRAVKSVENERSGLHSERCFMNFQMEIANAFKDQTFYFPHNMDFRGRAYPIPTYLNHMGADHARAILRFANGKELGENGLRWLKVHLANVFGFDKASIKERENFAMENVNNIVDSATNPLNGMGWWMKAEDQWQCLATCFELRAAMQLPDPTKYVSHLPVHQDGTCNGLQHYAALGGDVWGAQQVNLEPSDRPADVYSAVAELVKGIIAEDVKKGNPLAKAMDGKIARKIVKQTVMTNVYGVTFMGARTQVLKQIDAAHPKIQADTGIPATLLASYVATQIFKALSTMFRGAHDIQYWLGECAGRVCRALTPEQLDRIEDSENRNESATGHKRSKVGHQHDILNHFRSTIVWTTPLRMPVVQPYRRNGVRTISTVLQDLNLTLPERSDPVNRRKQLQAFPPNFIHSLDATHMLLSALECDELGLSFAAVHDSFWTHAADIDVMNRVLRDSFIRIHSEDVIQRLASEFGARYKGSLYYAKVANGTPCAKEIKAHRHRSKLSAHKEALEERERLRLLQSTDPVEVQKGQEMVTPASIFEQFAATEEPTAEEDMNEIGLGSVPSPEEILKSATPAEDADATSDKDWGPALHVNARTDFEDSAALRKWLAMGAFEQSMALTKKPPKEPREREPIRVWLPLAFPKIPEKGEFDVRRLKASQYFFS
ncbi:DNA-directed RNA polymerase [Xylariales sp. AK1849]|nr:DNA-directed RNA polymerase [Xylariales sp. AK1849]